MGELIERLKAVNLFNKLNEFRLSLSNSGGISSTAASTLNPDFECLYKISYKDLNLKIPYNVFMIRHKGRDTTVYMAVMSSSDIGKGGFGVVFDVDLYPTFPTPFKKNFVLKKIVYHLECENTMDLNIFFQNKFVHHKRLVNSYPDLADTTQVSTQSAINQEVETLKQLNRSPGFFSRETKKLKSNNHSIFLVNKRIAYIFDIKASGKDLMSYLNEACDDTPTSLLRHEQLTLLNLLNLTIAITKSIKKYHEAGFLHNDIKLENMMIELSHGVDECEITLVDVANSCSINKSERGKLLATVTKEYCAPELVKCLHTFHENLRDLFTVKTDMYATGASINRLYDSFKTNEFYQSEIRPIIDRLMSPHVESRPQSSEAMELFIACKNMYLLKHVYKKSDIVTSFLPESFISKFTVYNPMFSVLRELKGLKFLGAKNSSAEVIGAKIDSEELKNKPKDEYESNLSQKPQLN